MNITSYISTYITSYLPSATSITSQLTVNLVASPDSTRLVSDGDIVYRRRREGTILYIDYSDDGGVTWELAIAQFLLSEDVIEVTIDDSPVGYRDVVRDGAYKIDQLLEGGTGDWDTEGTDWENIISISPWTHEYFVSNTGDDSGDGLTWDTAWQTIAKVNASSFVPRDRISFKKGDVWRETLTVASSGGESNPITIGSYGSGDDPIIDGTDIVSDFALAELSPNVGFDSDVTGWTGSTLSWQDAAIGGREHIAKMTANSTSDRYIESLIGSAGNQHTIEFDCYIPSTNTTVTTIRISEGSGTYTYIGYVTPTANTWTHYSLSWNMLANNTKILIYMTAGSGNTNCTVGDIIYLDNISIKASSIYYDSVFALVSPNLVYVNDVKITKGTSLPALTDGQWYFQNGKLVIRNDAEAPTGITATARNYALTTNNKAWITVQDSINIKYGTYKRFQDNFVEDFLPSIDH